MMIKKHIYIHKRMLKLYSARYKLKIEKGKKNKRKFDKKWRLDSINRLIKKQKTTWLGIA